MKFTRQLSRLQVVLGLWLLIFIAVSPARGQARPASASHGQSPRAARAANRNIPALLISDIHFDPFHEPVRARQLIEAPVSQWEAILSAPPWPNQQPAFDALQQKCHARGVDSPYSLLRSSLQAMRSRQPDAKFLMLSGDLLAHEFSCRYQAVFPTATPGEYQSFVLKTLSFVVHQLRAAFPRVPIYVALGNNDSACGDYRLDAGSDFLAQTAQIVAEGLPPSERQQARKTFAQGGYYSLTMAAPMRNTRLIVVNDIFQSPKYRTCAGKPDTAAAADETAWLQQQLTQAQRSRQRVWVMGHIPPGVDPFSTVAKLRDVCGNGTPEMFQTSNQMADLLIEHADIIRLGVFAHSHMDEMRLLRLEDGSPQAALKHSVAVKIVPSISPVDGNNPSFTVARVNPISAILQDYEVIAASGQTGAAWFSEYDYGQAYHEAQFSPSTLSKLIADFEGDRGAKTAASQEYIRNYYVGDRSLELTPFWPQYVCALGNYTAKAYAACVCSGAPGK